MIKLKNYSMRGRMSKKNKINTFIGPLSDIHPIYTGLEVRIDSWSSNPNIFSLNAQRSKGDKIPERNLFAGNCIFSISEFKSMISQCGGTAIGNCNIFGNNMIEGLAFFSIRQVFIEYFHSQKLVIASGPENSDIGSILRMYNNFADKIGTFNKWEVSKSWHNSNSGNINNLYTLDLNDEEEPLRTISDKTIEYLEGL